MKVWINGALVAEDEAVLPASDHGITVGDGLFESMKVVDGIAFAVGRHLARLRRTASGLGLAVPSDDALRDAIESTIAANGPDVGRVRVTVTGGAGPAGTLRGDGPVTVLVQCSPLAPWPPAASVLVVPWPRNERGALAGLKTTSYAENVIALAHAHERGADEALFGNTAGNLCEGTGTNVFVVVDDEVLTPPLSAGCLAGVTRELLLEVDRDIDERDVPLTALGAVDEAFLTSSTRDVMAVSAIDGRRLARIDGPHTQRAARVLRELQARTIDP